MHYIKYPKIIKIFFVSILFHYYIIIIRCLFFMMMIIYSNKLPTLEILFFEKLYIIYNNSAKNFVLKFSEREREKKVSIQYLYYYDDVCEYDYYYYYIKISLLFLFVYQLTIMMNIKFYKLCSLL
jgi:hypothetical protein